MKNLIHMSSLKIKSGVVSSVKGIKPDGFNPPALVTKNGAILKMYSDGQGNFQGIK